MVHATNLNHNGTNGHFLNCASDYEERPLIDITPAAPRPAWRDQFPMFTHNLSWVDADGCSQSMTLRSDDLQSLMADLRLLKGMIKQAKESAKEKVHGDSQAPVELTAETDVKRCAIHNVDMPRRISKRNSGHYFAHFLPDDSICYGRERKA
jgi:hypothetical protein